jgi:hypothetical protein
MAELAFAAGDLESGVPLLNAVWQISSSSPGGLAGLVLELQSLSGLAEANLARGDLARGRELIALARSRAADPKCPAKLRTHTLRLFSEISADHGAAEPLP